MSPGSHESPQPRWIGKVVLAVLVGVVGLAIFAAVKAGSGSTEDAQRYAAAAAGLTVAVIAYQSWETRRATEVAGRALTEARRSVGVSERLALEAAKTRLDARATRLLVTVEQPTWPPHEQLAFRGGTPPEFPGGHVFRLPKDAGSLVLLQAQGLLRNEGDQTASVNLRNVCVKEPDSSVETTEDGRTVQRIWRWSELHGDHQREVTPGTSIAFLVREARSVEQWVANAEAVERNEPPPNAIGAEIIYFDPFDNGVIDNWRIEIAGRPLERVEGEIGAWRFPALPNEQLPISARVHPQQRHYFHSKSANTPFAE